MNHIEAVLSALRRVIRATDLHSKHLAKTTGLTAPQILLLQAIQNKNHATVGELADNINLSQATVTSILDRLEKRNLAQRIRSNTDKRKVHVALTETGTQILETAPPPLQSQFIQQFDDLQDWEQSMIIAALQRIAKMMDAQNIDAAPILDVGNLDRQNIP